MNQIGLRYQRKDGLPGKLYFDIIRKEIGKDPSTLVYIIRVLESCAGFEMVPIQEYKGYYNSRRDRFSLYPCKLLNCSILDYPFIKRDIDGMIVYDLSLGRRNSDESKCKSGKNSCITYEKAANVKKSGYSQIKLF